MSVQEFFDYLGRDARSAELAATLATVYATRLHPAPRVFTKAS